MTATDAPTWESGAGVPVADTTTCWVTVPIFSGRTMCEDLSPPRYTSELSCSVKPGAVARTRYRPALTAEKTNSPRSFVVVCASAMFLQRSVTPARGTTAPSGWETVPRTSAPPAANEKGADKKTETRTAETVLGHLELPICIVFSPLGRMDLTTSARPVS